MRRLLIILACTLATPAGAVTMEGAFKMCEAALKEEFGEAKVEFKLFRRNDGRHMAFGELEMTDGTTQTIRCSVRKQRVLGVNFRSDGQGSNAWTKQRPPNAGFIEPPKDETETDAAAQPEEAEKQEPTGPVRKSVVPKDPAAEQPAAPEQDAKAGDAADKSVKDTDAADKSAKDANAAENQPDKPADATKTAEKSAEKPSEEPAQPVSRFKKAPQR